MDCGASLSRPVRFDLSKWDCFFRFKKPMSNASFYGLRCDFSTNKLTISTSKMSFCNFNSKSDGRRYDFFFHLNTAFPFSLQNLVQRLSSQIPSSVSSTPSEVSAIPCHPFSWKIEIFSATAKFSALIRGDLSNASSGFGRLGQNPAGAISILKIQIIPCNFAKCKQPF